MLSSVAMEVTTSGKGSRPSSTSGHRAGPAGEVTRVEALTDGLRRACPSAPHPDESRRARRTALRMRRLDHVSLPAVRGRLPRIDSRRRRNRARVQSGWAVPFLARGSRDQPVQEAPCLRQTGVVIALNRLNRVLRVDPVDRLAVVEPGTINLDVSAAALPHGLFYAPDPSSQSICTIGSPFLRGIRYCGVYRGATSGRSPVAPRMSVEDATRKRVVIDIIEVHQHDDGQPRVREPPEV